MGIIKRLFLIFKGSEMEDERENQVPVVNRSKFLRGC